MRYIWKLSTPVACVHVGWTYIGDLPDVVRDARLDKKGSWICGWFGVRVCIFKIGHDMGYLPQHSQDCFFSCLLSTCSVVDFAFFLASSNFLQLVACMYMVSSFCVALLAMHIPHYSLVWPLINCMTFTFLCSIHQGIMHCLFCCHLHIASIYTPTQFKGHTCSASAICPGFSSYYPLIGVQVLTSDINPSISTSMTMMLDVEPHC